MHAVAGCNSQSLSSSSQQDSATEQAVTHCCSWCHGMCTASVACAVTLGAYYSTVEYTTN
eukprot:18950-Heterococcus_DN1.PRE.2